MVIWRFLILALALSFLHAPAAGAQSAGPPDVARIEFVLPEPAAPPFEREMVIATLRGTYSMNITQEKVEMPQMRDIEWIQLEKGTWDTYVVEGRTLQVFERRYAVFPRRAGTLTFKPVIQLIVAIDRQGTRREIELKSEPVTLQGAPIACRAG